jgi:heme exporter protein D
MGYVYAGYGVTVLALVGYALRLVARERTLKKR